MQEEMTVLEQKETWELITLSLGKKIIRCEWVYILKLNPDGALTCLKTRLVVKGHSQVY